MPVIQHQHSSQNQPIRVIGKLGQGYSRVLTPEALQFIADLERRFGARRTQLLGLRQDRQYRLNEGEKPDFRGETMELRDAQWQVRNTPTDLLDRRIELLISAASPRLEAAFNSAASCVVADFEDHHAPTWEAMLEGQQALCDRIERGLPAREDKFPHNRRPTLIVRPRGWHLEEAHIEIDGRAVSASLFDFALFLFHNGHALVDQGSGPYFYLPKLENYIEAQLWADVFAYSEESLGLSPGSICCSVAIETLPAVFEMEEILFTLRDYVVGLNCGRQDYLFSFIKRFQSDPQRVLPDPSLLTQQSAMIKAYSDLLVKTCHRRGAHAIGELTASITAAQPTADVCNALELEALAGFDGCQVALPELVPIACEVFERLVSGPHQRQRLRNDVQVTQADLISVPNGAISEQGLQQHIRVGIRYLAAWLGGEGVVSVDHRIQGAANAEFARTQLWQWTKHPQARLQSGETITLPLIESGIERELEIIRNEIGRTAYDTGHYAHAAELLGKLLASKSCIEFMTQSAYRMPA